MRQYSGSVFWLCLLISFPSGQVGAFQRPRLPFGNLPGAELNPGVENIAPHGMFDHLEHDLFQQNEQQRLLGQTRRAVATNRMEDAAELLQALLSLPEDSFIIDSEAQQVSSLRASAAALLKDGPPELQLAWRRRVETIAASQLESALSLSDRLAIHQVARQFPFTDAGVRAAKLVIIDFRMRAQTTAAGQYALQQAQLYTGHAVYFSPFNLLAQQLLAELALQHRADSKFVRPSGNVAGSQHALSSPWPGALWSWSESLSSDRQRGDNFRLPAPRLHEAAENPISAAFVNSIPLLHRDILIFRASSRLLGFDKMTGRQLWQLPTDTDGSADSLQVTGASSLSSSPDAAFADDWTVSRATFGSLAGDEEYVFFIDHFRSPERLRQSGLRPQGQLMAPGRRGFPGLPNLPPVNDPLDPRFFESPAAGNRLVALRYPAGAAVPVVAWSIGTEPAQPYTLESGEFIPQQAEMREAGSNRIVTADTRPRAAELPVQSMPDRSGEFHQHQFLCIPCGNDSQLFVLTATTDQVWASSVDRHSGQLRWRQPLVHDHDIVIQRMLETPSPEQVDVCLLVNDLLICVLSSGTVTALRPTDGQPQWATSLRDSAADSETLPVLDRVRANKVSAAFLPVVAGTTLICSCSQSNHVYGISTINGQILWKVSRRPQDFGTSTKNYDTFIAGIDSARVILLGPRHCRSISLRDGRQQWITEMIQPTGRAWCDQGRCLVVESDGRTALINTLTGEVNRVPENLMPADAVLLNGALSGDDDVVVMSGQESVMVLLRADTLLRQLDQIDSLRKNAADRYLVKTQAQLLSADRRGALKTLSQALRELKSTGQQQSLQQFAAELLLQQSGRQILKVHNQSSGHNRSLFDASEQLNRDLRQLEGLQLDRSQQIRLQLLQTLGQQRAATQSQPLPELVRDFRLEPLISVDGDWQTHAALLMNADLPERWKLTPRTGGVTDHLRADQIEATLLDRDLIAEPAGLLQSVQQLHSRDETAAELLLLAGLQHSCTHPEQIPPDLRLLLQQIHQPYVGSSDQYKAAGQRSAGRQHSSLPPGHDVRRSLQHAAFHQHLSKWTTDAFSVEVGAFHANVQMPFGSPLIWRMKESFVGETTLAGFDPVDGSKRDEVVVPFAVTDSRIAESSSMAPRLILLCGTSDVAVVSAVRPGAARLLWHKRVREIPLAGVAGILPGPVGPDFAIWQSGRRLNCSHPLTGRLLWSRECFQQPIDDSFNPINPIFGDQHVIVVMGSDLRSYRRFRTRDGYFLGSGTLEMDSQHVTAVVGRKLLYLHQDQHLRLFDPLSERPPISFTPQVNMQGVNSLLRVLSEARVLAVTQQQELALIDTRREQVLFRIPVKSYMKTSYSTAVSVFERNDRLFVFLSDEHSFGQQFRALPLFGEPRVDFGWLFCIDPHSGTLNWAIQTEPAVMLPIYGDRTDLLIGTCIIDDFGGLSSGRAAYRSESRLRIQVIDQHTGALVLERADLFPEFPLRCVHRADTGETSIVFRSSVITISTSEP